MEKVFFLIFIICLYVNSAICQDGEYDNSINNMIPASPEANALGKYGEIPVSLYNGIPNITIPIWEIKSAQLSFPIYLSYHATGIRVEEIATNVGLGWTLNAGGIVTRSVRGIPDEKINGFLNNPIYDNGEIMDEDTIRNIAQGKLDGEADVFYFNFVGFSGSFFFDENQEVVLTSKDNIRIWVNYTTEEIYGFEITTPSGDVYFFGEEQVDGSGYHEETIQTSETNSAPNEIYSSWYLRKTISAFRSDEIHFNYESFGSNSYKTSTISETVFLNGNDMSFYSYGPNVIYTAQLQKRIVSILYSNGEIIFNYDSELREDLPVVANAARLKEIRVLTSSGELERRFELFHNYFQSDGLFNTNKPEYAKRLRLNSIVEFDHNGNSKPPYSFEYFTEFNLPPREGIWSYGTYDQDHWGFYNKANNLLNTLIPSCSYHGYMYNSINREPAWPYTMANMLTKIIYPTGGFTEFTFEPNYIGMQGTDTLPYYYDRAFWDNSKITCDQGIHRETYNFSLVRDDEDPLNVLWFKVNLAVEPVDSNDGCEDVSSLQQGTIHALVTNIATGDSYSLQASLEDNNSNSLYKVSNPGEFTFEITTSKTGKFHYTLEYLKRFNNPKVVFHEFEQFGGVRIKEINTKESVEGQAIKQEYNYTFKPDPISDKIFSTATITNYPDYMTFRSRVETFPTNEVKIYKIEPLELEEFVLNYIELSATSNIPLGKTQGGYVGYSEVTEYAMNGSTVYKYSTSDDNPDYRNMFFYTGYVNGGKVTFSFDPERENGFPYPPSGNRDWSRGQLIEKTIFDYQKVPQLKELFTYNYPENRHLSIKAARVLESGHSGGDYDNAYAKYYNISGWTKLVSKTTIHYSNGVEGLTTVDNFNYNGIEHYNVTRKRMIDSNGDEIETHYKYPRDYFAETMNFSAPTTVFGEGLFNLVYFNVYDKPIEITTKKNGHVTSGQIYEYKNFQNEINVSKIYQLEIDEPLASFTGSYLDESDNFIRDGSYKLCSIFEEYDKEKLLQYRKKDDIPTSLVWRYNNSLPTAKIVNASYSESFFDGFESGDVSGSRINWIVQGNSGAGEKIVTDEESHSGHYSFKMVNTTGDWMAITMDGPYISVVPGKSYTVSTWFKCEESRKAKIRCYDITNGQGYIKEKEGTGDWELIEMEFIAPDQCEQLQIRLIGNIGELNSPIYYDDIRVFPADAIMTTYTYDPLIGMTSSTNENNVTTFYEYDDFGRLILVKDDDGNILLHHEYHYKNQ